MNRTRERAVKQRLIKTNQKQSEVTIGIDLGDRGHAVCVLDGAGRIITEEAITNTRQCLTAFAQRYPAATIAMETGTHSPVHTNMNSSLHRAALIDAAKPSA